MQSNLAPKHPSRPLPRPPFSPPAWGLSRLRGCLVEISGSAASGALSCALMLVAEAQRGEEVDGGKVPHGGEADGGKINSPVAWVASTRSLFFPPDAVRSGVAPDRLVLLRLGSPAAQVRAANQLAQSGAFGLVVVDLVDSVPLPITGGSLVSKIPAGVPPLSRLAGFARKHRSGIVLLTEKPPTAPSLDPRVVQRFDASRRGGGIAITVIKDKGGGAPFGSADRQEARLFPGFRFERECREPAGMC